MNVWLHGGTALLLFFAALGFSHARDGVRPMVEWMFTFTATVLVAAVVVVFVAHVFVYAVNPLPLQLREHVALRNGTVSLSLNVSRAEEAAYYGSPYEPPTYYYLAAFLFFGAIPTIGYITGYTLGARITGFRVEWAERLAEPKRELVLHITPRVHAASTPVEVDSLAEALGEE